MTAAAGSEPQGQPESWTYVTGKRGRRKAASKAKHTAFIPVNGKKRSSYLSESQISSDHDRVKKQWLDSKGCRHLEKLLTKTHANAEISKAICLGVGSFDPEDGSWQTKRRAHVQLVAFATVVECLQERRAEKIKCFFQEPCFTDSDKAFLSALGYEAVDSPAGFDMISEESLVFGVHLYRDIYSQAIGKCIPAIFVGTDYDTWESTLVDWPRMKELDRVCDKAAFPDDDEFYPAFTSTSIHWRRPTEERKQNGSPPPGSSSSEH